MCVCVCVCVCEPFMCLDLPLNLFSKLLSSIPILCVCVYACACMNMPCLPACIHVFMHVCVHACTCVMGVIFSSLFFLFLKKGQFNSLP